MHPRFRLAGAGILLLVGACRPAALRPTALVPPKTPLQQRVVAAHPDSVTGVISASTGQPPGFASIGIPALQQGTHADSLGHFQFGPLPPGRHVLVIRRLGYAPRQDTITVQTGMGLELAATLHVQVTCNLGDTFTRPPRRWWRWR